MRLGYLMGCMLVAAALLVSPELSLGPGGGGGGGHGFGGGAMAVSPAHGFSGARGFGGYAIYKEEKMDLFEVNRVGARETGHEL
jgi:hypothetical protein